MRFVRMPKLRQLLWIEYRNAQKEVPPRKTEYDPERPWNSVWKKALMADDWYWRTQFEEPALLIRAGIDDISAQLDIDAEIGHDAIEPGVKARVALKLTDVSVHLDESLLDHIQRIFLVSQEAQGHRVDLALVALHQDAKSPGVAILGHLYEGFVLELGKFAHRVAMS